MSYIVGRIPGDVKVDPDAGGQGRQRKRERPKQKGSKEDNVSISDEAKRRSVSEEGAEAE